MRISKYFNLSNLTKYSLPQINSYQMYLLSYLSINILDKIYELLEGDIIITNTIRTIDDYNRLIKNGYNPSKTSDHFFAFSLTNNWQDIGLGAADFITTKNSIYDSYNKIIKNIKPENFGQIILEIQKNKKWIHISNPSSVIFNTEFYNKIKDKYLIYENGIYKIYKKEIL